MKNSKRKQPNEAWKEKELSKEKELISGKSRKTNRTTKMDEYEMAVKICSNIFSREFSHNLPVDTIKKILLVEGTMDKTFYSRPEIRCLDVAIIDIGKEVNLVSKDNVDDGKDVWGAAHEKVISKKISKDLERKTLVENESENESKDNKDEQKIPSIKNIILAIFRAFENYIDRIIDRENNYFKPFDGHVFGIVDKDDDDGGQLCGTEGRLFITDTHDLETLILSSDKRDCYFIGGKTLTQEELDKACYLAYQLNKFKKKAEDYISKKQKALLKKDNGQYVNFNAMVRDKDKYKLNLEYVISYLNLDDNQVKLIKNLFDKDSLNWKSSYEDFKKINEAERWLILNGHDIASAVGAVYPDMCELGMSFEKALVLAYDITKFYNTELGKALEAANLIKPKYKVAA